MASSNKVSTAPSETSMLEDFATSTRLALKTQHEILRMPLSDTDPNYRAKLMAKASVASQQVNAQLRADENQLKAARGSGPDFYDELKAALEDYRMKRAAKALIELSTSHPLETQRGPLKYEGAPSR